MRHPRSRLPRSRSAAYHDQLQSLDPYRLMLSPQRNGRKILRGSLLRLAEALVVIYVVLDAIAVPLFRPLLRWLARIRLVLRLEAVFVHLSPYVILALLLIPYVSAEPAKVYALYLMGTGHLITGGAMLAAAYLVSLVLVEQIYQAGKTKLRTIAWFATAVDWLFDFRDQLFDWMKSTRAWIALARLEGYVRETVSRWRLRWVDWFLSLRT
ncbi:MAG: hypothetical protein ACLPID_14585 [Beijerinckiaceae bacterium]